jgi:hypothetical protein
MRRRAEGSVREAVELQKVPKGRSDDQNALVPCWQTMIKMCLTDGSKFHTHFEVMSSQWSMGTYRRPI